MIVHRQMDADAFARMIVDHFDEMLLLSRQQPLVMGIALHPYIVGQPHRLRHLRRALEHIARTRDGGAIWITHARRPSARHVANAALGRGLNVSKSGTQPPPRRTSSRIYRAIFESVMNQRSRPEPSSGDGAVRAVRRRPDGDPQGAAGARARHIVGCGPTAAPWSPRRRRKRRARSSKHGARSRLRCCRLAVANATKADLPACAGSCRRARRACIAADQPTWARLASAFHLRVAGLARNAILQQYLTELVSRCSLIVALYEPPGNAACEHDEHAPIVVADGATRCAGAVRRDGRASARSGAAHLPRPREPPGGLAQMLGLA